MICTIFFVLHDLSYKLKYKYTLRSEGLLGTLELFLNQKLHSGDFIMSLLNQSQFAL